MKIIYADGVHDDSEGMQALLNGEPVYHPNGLPYNIPGIMAYREADWAPLLAPPDKQDE